MRIQGARRQRSTGIVMYPHLAEVAAETMLHEALASRVERTARRAEHLVYQARHPHSSVPGIGHTRAARPGRRGGDKPLRARHSAYPLRDTVRLMLGRIVSPAYRKRSRQREVAWNRRGLQVVLGTGQLLVRRAVAGRADPAALDRRGPRRGRGLLRIANRRCGARRCRDKIGMGSHLAEVTAEPPLQRDTDRITKRLGQQGAGRWPSDYQRDRSGLDGDPRGTQAVCRRLIAPGGQRVVRPPD